MEDTWAWSYWALVWTWTFGNGARALVTALSTAVLPLVRSSSAPGGWAG